MKNLKKDLQAANRELKALSKKVEKLIAAGNKVGQSKAAEVKPAKQAAAKKTGQLSAANIVLDIIRRSRKGVATAALKEKTGYQGQKLYNTIYTLKKQGKIKSAGKGMYAKA